MKVTIEIDLPEGQAIPKPEDIVRLTDPNWISDWWSIWDVKEVYLGDDEWEMLTDEEAREVLKLAKNTHDSDIGLNWDVFSDLASYVYEQRKAVA